MKYGPNDLWLAILLVLSLVGCAHGTCPERGGDPWREVVTHHFRIRTPLGAYEAAESAYQLERLYGALSVALELPEELPGRVESIVLEDLPRLSDDFDTDYVGLLSITDDGPLLVSALDRYGYASGRSRFAVHAHELTHLLFAHRLARLPRWVNEGMAEYLSTIELARDRDEATIGRADARLVDWLMRDGMVAFESLWDWDQKPPKRSELTRWYLSAWVWTHYLINEQASRYEDLLVRLARAEEPRQAWMIAFGGIEVSSLQAQVLAYADKLWPVRRIAFAAPVKRFNERILTSAEIHVARAEIWLRFPQRKADRLEMARAELAEALGHEPQNARALFLSAFLASGDQRLALALKLVESHPNDARGWTMLLRLGEQDDHVLERVVALAGEDGLALDTAAQCLIARKRAEQAAELARRAVRFCPWRADYRATLAGALASTGLCADADQSRRRAMDLLEEWAPATRRDALAKRLADYLAPCDAPAAVPAVKGSRTEDHGGEAQATTPSS